MKPINDDNIDEILFQLLEGEITGQERERLLDAIQSDEGYNKLWMAWQKTVLQPEQDEKPFNIAPLKKKSARIIPLHFKYAAAAAIVITIGVALLYNQKNTDIQMADIKPAGKKPVIQTPALSPNSVNSTNESSKDSALPLKEKIRYIAHKNLIIPQPVNEVPIITKVIDPVIAEPYQQEKLVEINTPVLIQNEPLRNSIPATETILVSIENEFTPKPDTEKPSLFSRITGGSRIKIENDSNTRTSKKIIIENKKYQIIAGF